jgi:hypothetical protein
VVQPDSHRRNNRGLAQRGEQVLRADAAGVRVARVESLPGGRAPRVDVIEARGLSECGRQPRPCRFNNWGQRGGVGAMDAGGLLRRKQVLLDEPRRDREHARVDSPVRPPDVQAQEGLGRH